MMIVSRRCSWRRKWRHLGVMGAGELVWERVCVSEPYRRERLLSFRDLFVKMSDEGYQLAQSLIAIGSGGLFGRGLGQGRQKFSYLPYPESDFIFAIVGEDFGLLGCLVVLALFVAFAFCGMRIAVSCPDRFGCLLAAGLTAMIAVQGSSMSAWWWRAATTGCRAFFSAGNVDFFAAGAVA